MLHRFSADRKWLGAIEEFEGARGLAVDDYGESNGIAADGGGGGWRTIDSLDLIDIAGRENYRTDYTNDLRRVWESHASSLALPENP